MAGLRTLGLGGDLERRAPCPGGERVAGRRRPAGRRCARGGGRGRIRRHEAPAARGPRGRRGGGASD
eukprot:11193896-Lingulodinium_polyedra.AAC.1